jgi:hypothetical protein
MLNVEFPMIKERSTMRLELVRAPWLFIFLSDIFLPRCPFSVVEIGAGCGGFPVAE